MTSKGVLADLEKIKSIVEWLVPTNVYDVHSFHGLATFYRRFIQGFSSLVVPIIDYIRKETFEWTKAIDKAILDIKTKMTRHPF